MPYGIYISGEGAQAQQQRLEVIANNLANVDTAGFKPDIATFQARLAEAFQQGHDLPGSGTANNLGGGVKIIGTETSFAPGLLKETGSETDMAIIGNGFFQVDGGDGETYLTRAGNLRLDHTGTLVTAEGRPVLSAGGEPIVINRNSPWSLSRDGFVAQDGTAVPLALAQPDSLDDLVKVGANLFRPLNGAQPVPPEQREIRQGFLELSAASPTRQMMSMIETTRAFEANARMIQTQDSALSSLIGRVLRKA